MDFRGIAIIKIPLYLFLGWHEFGETKFNFNKIGIIVVLKLDKYMVLYSLSSSGWLLDHVYSELNFSFPN